MWTLGKFGDALHASSASKKVQGSALLLGSRTQLTSWLCSVNQARECFIKGNGWHAENTPLRAGKCFLTKTQLCSIVFKAQVQTTKVASSAQLRGIETELDFRMCDA